MDRNVGGDKAGVGVIASLSARRAWIEIAICGSDLYGRGSLSARRAWIEIRGAVG